jgi:hypothetical protein
VPVSEYGTRKGSATTSGAPMAAFLRPFTQRTAVAGLRAWVKFAVLALQAPRS